MPKGQDLHKIIKEIIISAKEGGGDPGTNARLRLAIQNAKGANMPKDNIERAIKSRFGSVLTIMFETSFEDMVPAAIAVLPNALLTTTIVRLLSVRQLTTSMGASLEPMVP